MIYRRAVACALFFCVLSAAPVMAQRGWGDPNMGARVLDLVFPSDFASEPYFEKLILRFGDSDTQLVILVYSNYPVRPGGNSEMIRYSLASMRGGDLSGLISKMVAENPDVTAQDIAAKLKVDVTRSSIESKVLDRALKKLKSLRISPILETGICVDECPVYEYWYDDGQDSVHYVIRGDVGKSPQQELLQRMITFRAALPDLARASSAPKPSKPE